MMNLRWRLFRTVGFAVVVVWANIPVCTQALADGQLSALPNVGTSQAYSASQGQTYQNSANGTVTVTRVANDSVHLVVAGGLPPFDQTLSVTPQGSVTQPSPPNPFADVLNNVAAILAAAPPNLQKDAQWTISVSALSPIVSGAGVKLTPQQSKNVAAVPPVRLTTKVVSVSGNVLKFHGEGMLKQEAETMRGTMGADTTISIDFELDSGHLQSCSRTAVQTLIAAGNPTNFSQTTSLTAK